MDRRKKPFGKHVRYNLRCTREFWSRFVSVADCEGYVYCELIEKALEEYFINHGYCGYSELPSVVVKKRKQRYEAQFLPKSSASLQEDNDATE